jgi:hypothetical protein
MRIPAWSRVFSAPPFSPCITTSSHQSIVPHDSFGLQYISPTGAHRCPAHSHSKSESPGSGVSLGRQGQRQGSGSGSGVSLDRQGQRQGSGSGSEVTLAAAPSRPAGGGWGAGAGMRKNLSRTAGRAHHSLPAAIFRYWSRDREPQPVAPAQWCQGGRPV